MILGEGTLRIFSDYVCLVLVKVNILDLTVAFQIGEAVWDLNIFLLMAWALADSGSLPHYKTSTEHLNPRFHYQREQVRLNECNRIASCA